MGIKIITLNLFFGGLHFNAIENFLKEEKPDILCLQEAYDSKDKKLAKNFQTIKTLRKNLPNYFFHFAPEFLHCRIEGKIDIGNAIFSKFPIIKTNVIFYDIPYGKYQTSTSYGNKRDFSKIPRNLQYAQIKINRAILNLFNTHGIWGHHGNDTNRRLKMGQTIIDNVKDKKNVFLCGDFNLSPATQTIANIEKYLTNVFKNELVTTFNVKLKPHPGNYGRSVVDMMFTSKDVTIIEKYQPKVSVSDHFPLACIIDIS